MVTSGVGGWWEFGGWARGGEKKRKVGEAVEEAYKEAEKFKEGAGGKKKKHKSSKK